MNIFKKTIKNALKKKGLEIKNYDSYFEDLEKVRYKWLDQYLFNTIIDIGASNGGFAQKARNWFPKAQIYSFEPINASFEVLQTKFRNDTNFKALNYACSNNKGQSSFYLSSNSGSSSLLDMNIKHKEAYPKSSEIKEIKVDIDLLDNLLISEKLSSGILLKLDVQGGELLALEGAYNILQKTKLIFIEISFCQLYNDQPLVNEVIDYLFKRQFKLIGVENVSNSLIDGSFLQADLFFERIENE